MQAAEPPPEPPLQHDKYGFSIEDDEQHALQEEYYNGRYQSVVDTQRARWSAWLADNVVGVKETGANEGQTRPFRPLEARQNAEILEMARKGIPPEQREFHQQSAVACVGYILF